MMRRVTPGLAYFCTTVAIITTSGVVDVAIYTLARHKRIMDTEPNYGPARDRFGMSTTRKHMHHLATITAGPSSDRRVMTILSSQRYNASHLAKEIVLHGRSTDNTIRDGSEESPDVPQTYRLTTCMTTNDVVSLSRAEVSQRRSKDSEQNIPDMPTVTPSMWA